jgi:hypothetical protein
MGEGVVQSMMGAEREHFDLGGGVLGVINTLPVQKIAIKGENQFQHAMITI